APQAPQALGTPRRSRGAPRHFRCESRGGLAHNPSIPMQVMCAERYLTEDDVAAFQRDGYVIRRGLFTSEEIGRIAAWTDEVQHLPEVPGKYMMYFEPSLLAPGRRVIQRIENFSPYHAGFARLFD